MNLIMALMKRVAFHPQNLHFFCCPLSSLIYHPQWVFQHLGRRHNTLYKDIHVNSDDGQCCACFSHLVYLKSIAISISSSSSHLFSLPTPSLHISHGYPPTHMPEIDNTWADTVFRRVLLTDRDPSYVALSLLRTIPYLLLWYIQSGTECTVFLSPRSPHN